MKLAFNENGQYEKRLISNHVFDPMDCECDEIDTSVEKPPEKSALKRKLKVHIEDNKLIFTLGRLTFSYQIVIISDDELVLWPLGRCFCYDMEVYQFYRR